MYIIFIPGLHKHSFRYISKKEPLMHMELAIGRYSFYALFYTEIRINESLQKSSLACQCRGCFFLFFKDFCLKNGRLPCEQILRNHI